MWRYTNTDELYHYGVPGMKWGKRKARYEGVSTDGSKKAAYARARQQLAQAKTNRKVANKAYDKAYRNANSLILNSQFNKADNKRRNDEMMDAAKKAGAADKKYKAAKKAMKVAKKAANVEAKAVKQKYRDQYMKGSSMVGKIYAKLTDADKHYAEMMYGLNNGKYKKS
jgi:hypothetical protein